MAPIFLKMRITNDTRWKRVLIALYTDLMIHENGSTSAGESDEALDMPKQILWHQLSYLEKHQLVKSGEDDFFYLTKKGFDVAFELEKQAREKREKKEDKKKQVFVVFLTLILAITSWLNFGITVYPESKYISFWSFAILIFLSVILMWIKFKK